MSHNIKSYVLKNENYNLEILQTLGNAVPLPLFDRNYKFYVSKGLDRQEALNHG